MFFAPFRWDRRRYTLAGLVKGVCRVYVITLIGLIVAPGHLAGRPASVSPHSCPEYGTLGPYYLSRSLAVAPRHAGFSLTEMGSVNTPLRRVLSPVNR